ncbi:MAG: hypothetical protein PSV36_13765 [Algoriphagus sp.]|nr:hypothetical protein [Algoriphagus sp.]
MKLFFSIYSLLRRLIWALIVAFMLGVHNFYKQETKSPQDIVFTIEQDSDEENAAPKD